MPPPFPLLLPPVIFRFLIVTGFLVVMESTAPFSVALVRLPFISSIGPPSDDSEMPSSVIEST